MQITKCRRTRKDIEIKWREDAAIFDARERENPLPAFHASLDALAEVAITIACLPSQYAQGMRVTGFSLGEESGAENVAISLEKCLGTKGKPWKITLPPRALTLPVDPGSYAPPLAPEHAALVTEAIEQAKAYVRGERAQGLIVFDGDEDEDDEDEKNE